MDLHNGKSLYFFENKPSKEVLQRFLDALYEARARQLRDRYMDIDLENSPEEEIRKFAWLRQEEALSEAEFTEIREKILQGISDDSRDRGYL